MVSERTGNSVFDKCQQWPVILATSHKDFHIQLRACLHFHYYNSRHPNKTM